MIQIQMASYRNILDLHSLLRNGVSQRCDFKIVTLHLLQGFVNLETRQTVWATDLPSDAIQLHM